MILFQFDTQFMLAKAGAEGVVKTADQMQKKPQPDPTVYCTSFKVSKPNPNHNPYPNLNYNPILAITLTLFVYTDPLTEVLYQSAFPLTYIYPIIRTLYVHIRNGGFIAFPPVFRTSQKRREMCSTRCPRRTNGMQHSIWDWYCYLPTFFSRLSQS